MEKQKQEENDEEKLKIEEKIKELEMLNKIKKE